MEQETIRVGRLVYRRRGYVAVLCAVVVLGEILSGFASVTRDVTLPLILKSLHLGVAQAGLIFSGSFVLTVLTNFALGPILDRVGRKRGFQGAVLAAGVITGMTALVSSAGAYAVVGIAAGVSLAPQITGPALVSEEAPDDVRGLLMGIAGVGFTFGSIIVGLVAHAVLPSGHWRWMYLYCFAALPIVALAGGLLRETPYFTAAQERRSTARAFRDEWRLFFQPRFRRTTVALLAYGFAGNLQSVFFLALGVTFLTTYQHLAIGTASLAVTLEGLFSVLGGIVLGRITDHLPSRNVAFLSLLLGSAAMALLSRPGGATWVFVLVAGWSFFTLGGIGGAQSRYIAESYPTEIRGRAFGILFGGAFIASIVTTAAFGALMGSGHEALAPLIAMAVGLVGGLLLLLGRSIPARARLEEGALTAEEPRHPATWS
ncbi:MAG: MFS transporter [Firmicutes bacterium]|nr:MFS transporter [Alicyclobacillaceae bacterium]MCL6498137.1 MFS transporter [Bacillota bacterium]